MFRNLFSLALLVALSAPAIGQETAGPGGIFFRRGLSKPGATPEAASQPEAKPVEAKKAADEKPISAPQSPEPREVDSAEVVRRGDRVTRAGTGPMSVADQLIGEATSPPPDDSHKWFLSIIVDDGQESQALLYDLKHSPHLRAWANLDEPKESWSHCTVYKRGDATQDWRWKDLRIAKCPVMILQPPAKLRDENQPDSWELGNPKIVVWQWDGYDVTRPTRAQLRSDAIRSALTAYVGKLSSNPQFVRQAYAARTAGPQAPPPPTPGAKQGGENIGINPPFSLPAPPGVPSGPVMPVFPTDPTQVVAQPNATTLTNANAVSLLLQILGGTAASMGFQNVLLLVLIGIQTWRAVADKLHLKTLLSDQGFGVLTSVLESLTKQPNQATTAAQTPNASGPS